MKSHALFSTEIADREREDGDKKKRTEKEGKTYREQNGHNSLRRQKESTESKIVARARKQRPAARPPLFRPTPEAP